MKLIAKKPCSFGSRQFYIGNEIPENLVSDAKRQEKMGVITIVNEDIGISGGQSGSLFTQEQVEKMIAEAVEEAEKKTANRLAELQEYAAGLEEIESQGYDSIIQITVKSDFDGEYTTISANSEEIQQVFTIIQLNAEEGVKAIAEVKSENILILLHAADSRKTIKNAAKQQVDKLFSIPHVSNESGKNNEATDSNTEGVDR